MAHVDNLRRYFPAVRHVTYLNTGTCGPLSDAAANAMQATIATVLSEGRSGSTYYPLLAETKQKVREQLASLFHASAECFALTGSTTEGMNLVLSGFPFAPFDEIIVTDTEHMGALLPAFSQKRRQVVVKVVNGNLPPDQLVKALEASMTRRTRMIVVSHVSYETGYRLPLERLAELAHAYGAYLAVDGAQGAGAEDLNLSDSNVDFYAFPGQKWLCGPDGTGGLYVRKSLWSVLEPSFVGFAGMGREHSVDLYGTYAFAPDARRYEHEMADLVNWSGMLASLEFLRVSVGWDYAYSRIKGASGRLMEQLLDFSRVQIRTPRDMRAGLVSFQVEGMGSSAVVKEALSRSIDIRGIPGRDLVRVSTGFYNTDEDLDRLINFLSQVTNPRL